MEENNNRIPLKSSYLQINRPLPRISRYNLQILIRLKRKYKLEDLVGFDVRINLFNMID
jgi:hypothetical protein